MDQFTLLKHYKTDELCHQKHTYHHRIYNQAWMIQRMQLKMCV